MTPALTTPGCPAPNGVHPLDSDAYVELVERHGPGLVRLVARIVRDEHLAEDVVQEVWILVHRNLFMLRVPERFPGWVRRIAVREGLRTAARLRARRAVTEDLDSGLGREPEAPRADPTTRCECREEAARALTDLRGPERRAVWLVAGGCSYAEVARRLDRPVGSVATWLHRARRRQVS